MGVKGYQGTSLLDFPGRIASLVFLGGCNLTCPFCHNPALVLAPQEMPDCPPEVLLADLERRRSFIDGVVISGGEPTLDPGLQELLESIKKLGLQVKVDTNGLRPEVLERLFAAELIDFLALDLKTAPGRYGELHSGPVDGKALERSIDLLLASDVECELRTTCVPGLVAEEDIRILGQLVRGARRWVLQQFVPHHALAAEMNHLDPYPAQKMNALAALAGEFVGEVTIRGL